MNRTMTMRNFALTTAIWLAVSLFSTLSQAQGVRPSPKKGDSPAAQSGLTSALFYEILVGEMSAQAGDNSDAYQLLLDAARKSHAPALFERSVEIALRARAGDSALEAAQAWSRDLPDTPEPHRFVLQIMLGMNRVADTVEPIRFALRNINDSDKLALMGQLPRYFSRVADKKAALNAVETSLSSELTNKKTGAAAYAAIGTMRVLAEDAQGAVDAIRSGFVVDPQASEPAQLALGLMDAHLPGVDALLQQYMQSAAKPDIRMAYVRKLLEGQQYAQASAQVMKLTAEAPDYADGWLVRGSLEMQSNDREAAKKSLQTYLSLKTAAPSDSSASTTSSNPPAKPAASTSGDSEESDATPGDASAVAPERGLVQAYFMLAQIAEQEGQYAQANQYLDQIASPADTLRINSQRASILAHQGQLAEARKLIQSTPENEPADGRAKIDAEAQLLREHQQFQAEYELLHGALVKSPKDTDLLYDLAMVADKLSKNDEMESLLRQVMELKPEFPHAYNALGYSLAERNIRLPEARTLIGKALEFAPNDPYIVDSLGWVEYRSGNLDTALKILEGAYQNKRDPEIAAHLAEVLWKMDQTVRARDVLKQGLSISPDNEALRETVKRLGAW